MLKSIHSKILSINWGAVIIEDKALSFGRIAGWIALFMLVGKWSENIEPSISLVETFWALLIYNAGKKMTGPVSTFLSSRSSKSRDLPLQETHEFAVAPYEPSRPVETVQRVDIRTNSIRDSFAED